MENLKDSMKQKSNFELKDKTIDFYGSKWRLKFVDAIKVEDNSSLYGITDSANRLISIDKNQPDNELQITALHELIHAILDTGQYLNSSRDEPMVEWLARGFYTLIKQGVFEWKNLLKPINTKLQ